MGSSTVLLVVLFVCIVGSAFFSSSETAFSCANRMRLKSMEQEGDKKAGKVLKIIDDYDSMLSAILIGNNIVNIAASSICTVLFVRAMGDIGATWSTLVLTIVILIFGEVTPKSIAKEIPEKLAKVFCGPIDVLMKIFLPLTKLFAWWKKAIKKIFNLNAEDKITEEEFMTMVDEAESDGGISEDDSELIKNVMDFNDAEVGEIITPRVDIIAVPLDATEEEVADAFRESDFTRIPVYDEDLDDIVGFIHAKDFADDVLSGDTKWPDIVQKIQYFPPTMKISKALDILKESHIHMAVVSDEFGGTEGLITMEDILEELVGEIYDEHDEVESNFVEIAPNEYAVDCGMDVEDFFEFFQMEEPDSDSNTVAGWALEQFEEIPEPGQKFTYENLEVTAMMVNSKKLEEIAVKVLEHEERNDPEE